MLESVSERLMETVHAGSPTKHPARRLETIEAAGELRIPFTSGILVGIGESEEERVASLDPYINEYGVTRDNRRAWFMDQYRNPHESLHTLDEVLGWFEQNGIRFVRARE